MRAPSRAGAHALRSVLLSFTFGLGLTLGLAPFGLAPRAAAQDPADPAVEAEAALGRAAELLRAKKFDEAAAAVAEAREKIRAATGGTEPARGSPLARLIARADAADRLLKGKVKPPAGGTPPMPGAPGTTPAGEPSFVKDVLPMLTQSCGGCHMRAARGGLSMATFTSLMRGTQDAGIVINPGRGEGSRLIDVTASGEMPPGNGKLSLDQVNVIKRWIDAGAKFDGPDPNAPLLALSGATPTTAAMPAAPTLVAATGSEKVKFERDLAPILQNRCAGCHRGQNPPRNLDLTAFRNLLRGGQSGGLWVGQKPADSLLVKKLRGTSGDRMPLRQPPLDEEQIKLFETWIAEGAKFDGLNPDESFENVLAMQRALALSHEELAAERTLLAAKNYRTALPDLSPATVDTESFHLVGAVSSARLTELGAEAEASRARIAKALRLPAAEPFVRGKLTIFVMKNLADYAEFGTLVEKRNLPPEWRGHFRGNVIDAYVVLVPAADDPELRAEQLDELLAGAFLQSMGPTPHWFAFGGARYVAAKLNPKSLRARDWMAAAAAAGSDTSIVDDVLASNAATGQVAGAAMAMAGRLAGDSRGFPALLAEMRKLTPFTEAFKKVYRADVRGYFTARPGRTR